MRLLIVFGSTNDEPTFSKIALKLKENKIQFSARILSAHRTLDELKEELSKQNYDIIVAGAGLSAVLPGIIAAHTVKPVIGLPLKKDYAGLDALLSIHQMPSGIPVIALGVENYSEVLYLLSLIQKLKSKEIILVKRKKKALHEKVLLKAIDLFRELKKDFKLLDLTKSKKFETKNSIVIELIEFDAKAAITETNKVLRLNKRNNNIALLVPITNKSSALDSIKLLRLTRKGLWLGLNNSKNAVLAALSFFPENHAKLKEFRAKEKEKILAESKAFLKKYA